MAIWGPTLAKGSLNRPVAHKINIQLERWNMFLGWIYDVKMGGLDGPKQIFRNTLVTTYIFVGELCEM